MEELSELIGKLTLLDEARICTNTTGNEYKRTAPLAEVGEGTPFAIYPVADQLVASLAVDFDSKLGDAFGEALALWRELDDEGLNPLLCASGPTGGYHLWLMFEQPQPLEVLAQLREGISERFPSVDPTCMLPTSCLRPPGAPHRLGGISTLIAGDPDEPGLTDEQVGFVVETWGASVSEVFESEEKQEELLIHSFSELLGKLSPKTLAEGQTNWAKGERSEAQFRFVLGCVNSGLNVSEIEILMEQLPVGARWRSRSDEHELSREVEKAKRVIGQTLETLESWRQLPTPSTGRAGTTERVLMEVLYEAGRKLKSTKFSRSVRQLAEDMQVGANTVVKVLGRIKSAGYLEVRKNHNYQLAQEIRIIIPKRKEERENGTLRDTKYGVCFSVSETSVFQHNLFNSKGLGPSCGLIYQAIITSPQTVADLCQHLDMSDKTARKHLKTLKSLGLARDSKRTWKGLEATTEALDELAESLLITDRRKELNQRHAIERNLYQRDRERLRSSNEETFTGPF